MKSNTSDNSRSEQSSKLSKLYDKKKIAILSHFESLEYQKSNYKASYYAQKLFPWFCQFRLYSEVFWMMEKFHCSPFVKAKSGYNTLHHLAQFPSIDFLDLLDLLLNKPDYEFYKSG